MPPSTQNESMSKPWKLSSFKMQADWQAPTLMFLCLMGAVIFAGAHHAFYLAMDGQLAPDQTQAWVIRGGTAFAYVVKVLLVIAAGIAYVQMMWRGIRNRNTRMAHLNHFFSVLENVIILAKVKTWYRNPLLFLLAAITWCLPIIAIIPPGAMSVISTLLPANGNTTVFYTPFWHSGISQSILIAPNSTTYRYVSAGTSAFSTSTLTVMTGAIINAELPKINMTFSDTFFGPALSCQDASPETADVIAQATLDLALAENVTMAYMSRVPKMLANESSVRLVATGALTSSDTNGGPVHLDMVSPDRASLYLTISGGFLGMIRNKSDIWTIRCGLYNASWNVDFDIRSDGSQSLKARNLTFINWVPGISPLKNPSAEDFDTFGYGGVLDTFAQSARGRLLMWPTYELRIQKEAKSQNTTSLQGLLLQSNVQLNMAINEWGMRNTARQMRMPVDVFGGDADTRENSVLRPLILSQLEDTFKNMTLSVRYGYAPTGQNGALNSRSYMFSNAVYPNGTITSSAIVFSYTQRELIITYVVGISVTLLTVLIGAYAIIESGKAYETSFSTIARVTHRQPALDVSIKNDHDHSGAEPTARAIKDATIFVGGSSLPQHEPKSYQPISNLGPGSRHPSPSPSPPPPAISLIPRKPVMQVRNYSLGGVGNGQQIQKTNWI